jgi:DNA-directed RNA polymerase specialized sigma subunit
MAASSRDDELYAQWKRTGSSMDLEALLRALDPLIQSEVNRRAGTLSRELLVLQAKKLAVDALRTYKPSVGVKISTHVTNQLQKLSRVNYAHQNAARIPEHSMLQFHSVNIATEDFRADNGRDPTAEELADTLKWSPKKLKQFQTQFGRSELLESIDTPGELFVAETHDPRVDYVYSTLSPRQQAIFEHTTGYHGRPKLTNPKIMAKLGITQGVLSYEKTKIKNAFQAALR